VLVLEGTLGRYLATDSSWQEWVRLPREAITTTGKEVKPLVRGMVPLLHLELPLAGGLCTADVDLVQ